MGQSPKKRLQRLIESKKKPKRYCTFYGSMNHNQRQYEQEHDIYLNTKLVNEDQSDESLLDSEFLWKKFSNDNEKQNSSSQ